jgi:sulfocyanin
MRTTTERKVGAGKAAAMAATDARKPVPTDSSIRDPLERLVRLMPSFIRSRALRMVGPAALAAVLITPTAALAAGASGMSMSTPRFQASHSPAPGTWINYNAQTKTVNLTLISSYLKDTFNFNGASGGKMTVKVPTGSTVKVTYSNMSTMMPHGAEVVSWTGTLPTSFPPPAPAFQGAFSPNYLHGTPAGVTQHFTFKATKAGTYLLICAVRNHVKFGHWAWFIVSNTATKATVTIKP